METDFRKPNKEELALKKKALKIAAACRAQLLIRQPFIGMLAMRTEVITVVDDRLPTACTDYKNLYFNAEFLMSLDHEERIYLMAHEIWHCVFLHFMRKGNREQRKFNFAADLEIDFMLQEQDLKVFDILPHEDNWRGKSAEEIYDLLTSDQDLKRSDKADVHIYEDTDVNSGSENKLGDEIVIDDDYKPQIKRNSERQWRQWVISAAQQVKRTKGSIPGYLEQLIQDRYKPELSWREILQQFVSYCFGGSRQWLPPNRRHIHSGLYLPSRKDDFLSVTVAIDTSGSTMNDLPAFLAELKGIVSSFGRYEVVLIECDMKIQNVRTFTEWEPFENEKIDFHGFGGTSFTPVFDYIDENVVEPRLLIYLTDGYGDAPDNPPQYPMLWVLTSDGKPPADWGWKAFLNRK